MSGRFVPVMRQGIAAALAVLMPGSVLWGQQAAIAPIRPSAPVIIRPYEAVDVPPVRLANSPRLAQLVRAGALYLTVQDAIALALENNIDIEVARYNPIIAEWNVERSEAGGALPGVPSNASQAGSVAVGQGVAGSQAAAGVRIAGSNKSSGQTANAQISQVGPVTQTLDPSIQESSTFSHTTFPQPNIVQSVTPVLISNTRAHSASYQQGFLTGGAVTVNYTDNYLNENSPTDVLNPSSATNVSISVQQNLLRGLGIAVNARTITISKLNVTTSDLNFRAQVIGVIVNVLNLYYGLAADYEDLKAKRNAAETARTFLANVRRQIELGAVAPPEAINAESQVVTTGQAVVDAEATLRQAEVQLKNLLSRTGTADPLLRSVRIVPVDRITIPDKDDLPPIEEMVKQARANRVDLAAEKQNVQASEISALGTRNGLLPTSQVFAGTSNAGLAGTPRVSPGVLPPDPYFVGGVGTALGQTFRRNFPTERIGAYYAASLLNRTAQADYAIDQLQLRQTRLSTEKDLNQVEVDILNYVIGLRQARARYDAAVQNRVLEEQLYKAEQRKYELGTSVPYNVIQMQRDLIAAQSAEMAALVAYSQARIALDRTLGRTLDVYHVSVAEARSGQIAK
jgi:outer membrane protein